jgi:hypothetical protein
MECDSMALQLTEQDFELLCRYLDGELVVPERIALEARIHSEPKLAQGLMHIRSVDGQVREAMVLAAKVPASISALLEDTRSTPKHADEAASSGNVLPFPGAVSRPNRQTGVRWPQALAASLVAGVGLLLIGDFSSPPPAALLPGNDSLLSAALDRESSGERWVALNDGRELRPVLTFAHEDGRWCREYLLRGETGVENSDWRAVACKNEDRWVTQAAGLESFLETTDAYRAAGSGDAVPVATFITQHAADIALGRDEERRLIESGWQ